AAGEVGQAVSFANANTSGKATASNSLNVGTANGFTIVTWIKPTASDIATQHPLFEWNNSSGGLGVHFWLGVTFSTAQGPANLYGAPQGGGGPLISSVPNLVKANIWQHVALTYDKTSGVTRLFWNGTVAAQQSLGTFTPQTSYDLYLGLRPGGER